MSFIFLRKDNFFHSFLFIGRAYFLQKKSPDSHFCLAANLHFRCPAAKKIFTITDADSAQATKQYA